MNAHQHVSIQIYLYPSLFAFAAQLSTFLYPAFDWMACVGICISCSVTSSWPQVCERMLKGGHPLSSGPGNSSTISVSVFSSRILLRLFLLSADWNGEIHASVNGHSYAW